MEDKLIQKITICMKEHWEWFKKTVLLRLTLLEKDMLFSVHDINIQQLALEMYKVAKGLAPTANQVYSCNVVIIDALDHNHTF